MTRLLETDPDPRRDDARAEARPAVAALAAAGITGPFDLAVVLGTGLGPVAEAIGDAIVLPYAAVPGFPPSGVSGHAGRLVAGRLGAARILACQGRAHLYEHGRADVMRPVLATLAALDVSRLLLTNAAGSLDPAVPVGSLCGIDDHINLAGTNPLFGDRSDARFVPMNDAYDPGLRAALARAAAAAGLHLPFGTYVWFSGPSFETPAEIRMAAALGGRLVGMSTVPEVILARRFGLTVAAVSLVTNLGAGMVPEPPTHGETKAAAAAGAGAMLRLIQALAAELAHG